MDRFRIQEAITILKPLCDSLMKNPNANDARKIADVVTGISDRIIQDLLEYILFPFITHLQNEDVRKSVKEELVRTVKAIMLKAKIGKIEYFNRIYACLLIQIYDKNRTNMVIEGHEELKEAVLSCLKVLVHSCFTEVTESLYTRQNASKLGQGILLSVTIARMEKSCSLRLAAIEAVMALCQVDDESDRYDIILQDQVADVIMLYLPGIASGLQEVAMGSEIQGHKLTVTTLKAWSRVISLVMRDKFEVDTTPSFDSLMKVNVNKSTDPLGTSLRLKDRSDLEKYLKSTVRSPEWFEAAAIKLNILVQELDVLKRHSHHKVRKELASNIHLILSKCSRNMKPNVMLLIEYLISLSEDDVAEVSEEAAKALDMVNINFTRDPNMRPMVELLEENFYTLLTKLPRIIRRSEDNEQLSCLNQVSGYLKVLGAQRLPRLMQSTPHIRRLLLALVYISEIDCSNISLLQSVNVKDLDDRAYFYGSHLWRRFKFIENKTCQAKVIAICKILGEFGDLRLLIDSIFELIINAPQHRKELVLLLNYTINVPFKDTSSLSLYKEVVELYINPDMWYAPIEVTEDVPLRVAQSNVVQCCLLIEGLGLLAQNLKQSYENFLLKTLYLVIERAGGGHSLISYVGTETLELIAKSQQFETVGDLLRANVDYFSYHVTIKLRRVERNPGVLDVVGVVTKYSTIDVLPCLKEIVEDVLAQLNNTFQQKNSCAFLKVFYTFVTCMKSLANCKDMTLEPEENVDSECEASKIIQSLLDYYEVKKIDEKIEEEPIETDCDIQKEMEKLAEHHAELCDSVEPEDEKVSPVPPYAKLIEKVMKQCLHFLPYKETQRSLIAMLTLQEGLTILAQWEDLLLPIVHLLWHPLVDRFHDENPLIINRAWQLLNLLAYVSKDFIRFRTLKQVLPALSKFLGDSAKESCNKSTENAYKFTQTYKLQKQLLSTLGPTAKNLRLHERELWQVLSIAEPYLNRNQNPLLQTCCVQLYKEIVDYNGDIAWVKCLSIWNSKVSKIVPDATFDIKDLEVPKSTSSNEYYKNVQTVIKYIQDKHTVSQM